MNIIKLCKSLTKFEITLWSGSVVIITTLFLISNSDWLNLVASIIGVTALLFVSKGQPIGQILTVVFSILYAVISYTFRYYGEMLTYVGMTLPIAVVTAISWIKHPYKEGVSEVKISKLNKTGWIILAILTILVTFGFYFVLKYFKTPNLIISTISIATSFSASALMLFRSPSYAIAYACNDIVLIILWILATIISLEYLPMVVCFCIFFLNDVYGFVNWNKMKRKQIKN